MCQQADPQVQLEPADPAGGSGRNSVWKETSPEQGPGGRAESAPARDRARRFWPQAAVPPAARASWGSGRGKPTRAPRARGGEPESLGPGSQKQTPVRDPASGGGEGATWPRQELEPGSGAALDPSGTRPIADACCEDARGNEEHLQRAPTLQRRKRGRGSHLADRVGRARSVPPPRPSAHLRPHAGSALFSPKIHLRILQGTTEGPRTPEERAPALGGPAAFVTVILSVPVPCARVILHTRFTFLSCKTDFTHLTPTASHALTCPLSRTVSLA